MVVPGPSKKANIFAWVRRSDLQGIYKEDGGWRTWPLFLRGFFLHVLPRWQLLVLPFI